MTEREIQAYFNNLSDEADKAEKEWRDLHSDDPCLRCGSKEGVEIITHGSVPKMEPLCLKCYERLQDIWAAWDRGYKAGIETSQIRFRQLSLWKRIRNKI